MTTKKIPILFLLALSVLVTVSLVHIIDSVIGMQVEIAKIEAGSRVACAINTARGNHAAVVQAAQVKAEADLEIASMKADAVIKTALAPIQILEKQLEIQMRFLKAQSERAGPIQ